MLHNHNSNNSNDEPKTYETTDQDTIRKATKTFYQKIYNKNNSVNPSKQRIKEFLDMDGNTSPWEALNKKRIPKEMAESMEGDLTHKELEDALYLHMNGSSSPGSDGFTVNYLRKYWHILKYVTKDALNAIQTDGLTQTLRSTIL